MASSGSGEQRRLAHQPDRFAVEAGGHRAADVDIVE
jgi:hypothetical protein